MLNNKKRFLQIGAVCLMVAGGFKFCEFTNASDNRLYEQRYQEGKNLAENPIISDVAEVDGCKIKSVQIASKNDFSRLYSDSKQAEQMNKENPYSTQTFYIAKCDNTETVKKVDSSRYPNHTVYINRDSGLFEILEKLRDKRDDSNNNIKPKKP